MGSSRYDGRTPAVDRAMCALVSGVHPPWRFLTFNATLVSLSERQVSPAYPTFILDAVNVCTEPKAEAV